MQTFSQLQEKLNAARNRKTVLMHIVDLIEGEFLSSIPESQPKRLLLNEEKVPVPQTAFNDVVDSILKEIAELDETISTIMQSTLKSSKGDDTKAA